MSNYEKSVFTKYLVEGLKSGKANPDTEVISFEDIYQFVNNEVREYVRSAISKKKLPENFSMSPMRSISQGFGSNVFAKNPNPFREVPGDVVKLLKSKEQKERVNAISKIEELISKFPKSLGASHSKEIIQSHIEKIDIISAEEYLRSVKMLNSGEDFTGIKPERAAEILKLQTQVGVLRDLLNDTENRIRRLDAEKAEVNEQLEKVRLQAQEAQEEKNSVQASQLGMEQKWGEIQIENEKLKDRFASLEWTYVRRVMTTLIVAVLTTGAILLYR